MRIYICAQLEFAITNYCKAPCSKMELGYTNKEHLHSMRGVHGPTNQIQFGVGTRINNVEQVQVGVAIKKPI